MKLLSGNIIKPFDKQTSKEPELLPKLPFTLQLIGQKSSGKSSTLLNLLMNKDMLAGKFHQIYYISPTASLDEKTNVLKETQGIVLINKPLLAAIKKKHKNKQNIFCNEEESPEYDTTIIDSHFMDDVSIPFLEELISDQKKVIMSYGKKLADDILLIYDDCASSKKFFNSKIVTGLIFNSRHVKISVIFSVQNYTSIPKPIRLNNSINIIYETYNKKELEFIYSENVSNYTFQEFNELFKSVIEIPYKFFVINYQNPKEYRFQNCFENFVNLDLNIIS